MKAPKQNHTEDMHQKSAYDLLPRRAEDLSVEGTNAFSKLIDCLCEVRDLQTTAVSDLGRFADLAAGHQDDGEDPLGLLCDAICAMHKALDRFCKTHADIDARTCHGEVTRLLSDINRHGQTLSVVATLTKTTAASYGSSAFVEYVDDLSKIAVVIRNASESVLTTLAELADREAASLKSCTAAFDRINTLMQFVESQARQITLLHNEERKAAQSISDTSRTLVDRSNQHMKVFVTAVQFSDRLAQRLDHLAGILNRQDSKLELLAAAHARSIAGDVTSVAQDVAVTMQALSEIWREGTQIYSSGAIAQSIEQSLDTRRTTAHTIIARFAQVRAALNCTSQDAETLPEMIAATKKNFKHLEENTLSVAYSAMNSALLASRSNKARHAMATLSFEVRDTAAKCLAAVKGSQKELTTLAENSAFGIEDLMETGRALEQAITAYESEIETGQQRLDQLGALRTRAVSVTSKLLELVQDAVHCMENVCQIAEHLDDMAEELEAIGCTTSPDADVLSEVWATYSMDEERAVHSALYPHQNRETAAHSEPDTDGDDLDDVFF